jgi:toxin FitB
MTQWLADTSVAVPLVLASHQAHHLVRDTIGDRPVGLSAHAAIETFSVLTRLPGDARLSPADASTLIAARFPRIAVLDDETQTSLVPICATAGVAGGAVYDALIAITTSIDGSILLTRDNRAAATYGVLGVAFELIV